MYEICPKCQHRRQANEQSNADVCPACGIIFSKWLKSQLAAADKTNSSSRSSRVPKKSARLAGWLFPTEENTSSLVFWSRLAVFIGLLIWGWKFIRMDFVSDPWEIGNSYMHNINLVFHEAGHVLFRPFGWFMTILGGSLFQILMPLIVMFTFLLKNKNAFGASVGLWWTGQSLIDVTPYIDDALTQKLVLLGGHTGADAPGSHDWNNLLGDLNMLERHREFAHFTDTTGTLLIVLALIWGGYVLYRQYGNLN